MTEENKKPPEVQGQTEILAELQYTVEGHEQALKLVIFSLICLSLEVAGLWYLTVRK